MAVLMDWRPGRVRAACIALVIAVLAGGALPARGQESPVASDIMVREDNARKSQFGSIQGFSSYGATLGGMRVFGGDLAEGATVRPVLQGEFRYRAGDRWIAHGEFGVGWSAFADRADTVFVMNFGTVGLLRNVGRFWGGDLRAGAGLGMYGWSYRNHGKSVRDPETQRFYKGIVPGGYLGGELEKRATRHVTVTAAPQLHYVLTGDDKFSRLFDSSHPFLSFRLGVHYHFSPYEGIQWERKQDTKVVMESGLGGK